MKIVRYFFAKKRTKLILKRALLLLVFLGYVSVLLMFAFRIAEKHFFDNLFYKKSWLHGYCGVEGWLDCRNEWNTALFRFFVGSNNYGYRDRDFYPKQEDEFVVMIIGDSNVWGTGMRMNQRFTAILERKLSKIRNSRVMALGKRSTNLIDHISEASEYENIFSPDLVVFTYFENDLLIPSWQEESVVRTRNNNNLIRDLRFDDKSDAYAEKVLGSYDENTENFRIFTEKVTELPDRYLYFILSYWPEQQFLKKVESLMRSEGLNVIDAFDIYSDKYSLLTSGNNNKIEANLTISLKEGHPNATAHQMFAERLFLEITCNSRYGFSNICGSF